MEHIGNLEKRLWSSADVLRSTSNFASNEYFMPVMGLIFLRHACSRYLKVRDEILPTLPSRGGVVRDLTKADFSSRSAIFLRPDAQFDYLISLPEDQSPSAAVIHAMETIEEDYEGLTGLLPKQEYTELDDDALRQVLRIFNDPALQKADGDVFGRIYEYFLTQFADQKAHDNGEFFTPISIVETIVNVIEPVRGKIIDPACGSGGMFVQSAHFVEAMKASPNDELTFYGMEKNPTTLRLAKMNLAVHGLDGDIQKAISYYEDPHKDQGPFDYVMANPAFNVDEIDAEKMKDDPRLTFGLPGVNKGGKVSNGNYVWISFFHAYLSERGRAGIVMSSQASSAGGQEAKVREALVKSGDMDIMCAIRGNFFYTRTVPCEIWFMDKGKPEAMRDKALMLDARHVFRKVTRKIFDFSPEQMQNLTAIVWLYRGQNDRFNGLVRDYLETARDEAQGAAFAGLIEALEAAQGYLVKHTDTAELKAGIAKLTGDAEAFVATSAALGEPEAEIAALTAARDAMQPMAEHAKVLIKEIDHLAKLAQKAQEAAIAGGEKAAEGKKLLAAIASARVALTGDPDVQLSVTGALRRARYFEGQAEWLLSRFPDGVLCDVEGLVKLVDHAELEANDYSLTPGRYVGVAPEVDDADFDFDATIREIHLEIETLNAEAVDLAETIAANFEELIV
ncbi:class I SAM-dependent DNA methyltransferase [Sulfitobacter guttiformis]|uniref:site-specific DNA-methyltransferase (adenine-specific) n=1 Tax=Sulfitobacter guttiformis TaxID=74349 RepID=A0A420DMT9_9RHOB|nr:N-6 DNA methylase [Sulfitobacter guttiformis]KIN72874.1 TypeI restriction-modification system, methylase subunit [Sulfitobacter guttiformis KCTC 32187]RKE95563.1 type I restriction enzyme M protein [Sulfitobacter guttiformis]